MMEISKFFIGIAIVLFATFCGRLLSKKYKRRERFLKQFREFNERFLSEISYYRRPIGEFISCYSYQGEFEKLLKNFYQMLKEKEDFSCFLSDEEYDFLKKEEIQMVENYFFMIGKSDSISQKGYFSSAKDSLEKLQMDAEKDAKRYVELYTKLGFLCGLLVLILIC